MSILLGTAFLYGLCIVLFQSYTNFDLQSYHQIGSLVLKGIPIYPDPALSRHPYLPFFLYVEALFVLLSAQFHIPEAVLFKSFFALFHLISVYYFYQLARRNWKITLWYAINPISLLVITFHGQFDVIPVALLLFALSLLEQKKYTAVGIALSLAVTLKTWPVLFIYPFLRRMPKKIWVLLFLLPSFFLLLYPLIFAHSLGSSVQSLGSILFVLLRYQGVPTAWGGGYLLSLLTTNKWVYFMYKLIFVGGFVLFFLTQRKTRIIDELLTLFLLFFVCTPGFGIQWLLWLVPFLLLSKKPFSLLFYVPLVLMLAVAYLSWQPLGATDLFQVQVVSLSTWICFVLFFVFSSYLVPRLKMKSIL